MSREPMVAALHVSPWDGERERTVDTVVGIIAEAVMVLAYRDGFAVSREVADERARNAACALLLEFDVTRKAGM